VTATPAAAAMPMKNAECQLKRRPTRPSGAAGELIVAATASALAMGPSCAASCGWPSSG
jgi:hypothetical protein